MKKFLYLAAACLLAACNGGEEPEQQPSLEVKPLQLDFAAADAVPQEIGESAGEYQGQTAQRDNSPGRERYACRLFADGGTYRTHLRA